MDDEQNRELEEMKKQTDILTFWIRLGTLMLVVIGGLIGYSTNYLSNINDELKGINTTVGKIETNQAVATIRMDNFEKVQSKHELADNREFEEIRKDIDSMKGKYDYRVNNR